MTTMHSPTKKLAILALFAALALGIYGLETLIPNPFPIPGVKLGLANIVTLVVLRRFGIREASLVLAVRILLSALLFGNGMTLLYSATGGILCLVVEFFINKFLRGHAIFVTAIFGALVHNAGQLLVAYFFTKVINVIIYAPYLVVAAILTGLFSGLCAHFTLKLLPKVLKDED